MLPPLHVLRHRRAKVRARLLRRVLLGGGRGHVARLGLWPLPRRGRQLPERKQRPRLLGLQGQQVLQHSPGGGHIASRAELRRLLEKDRGIGGPVVAASAYLMKSPPQQLPDDVARAQLEEFIAGE